MKYLITGGCGFIGSHLAQCLIEAGNDVLVLDDLSTGSYENVEHLNEHKGFNLVVGSVLEGDLVREAVKACDGVFHLACVVGVQLVMEQTVRTIETTCVGTHNVLRSASQQQKPVLITSSSEVYGKSQDLPFDEDGDRLQGSTQRHRWAYASAKAMDEFLALAYWRESQLPVVIVRLFNTVGPRQHGRYGMVVPNFVNRCLSGDPIEVHGDGSQTRCFTHVRDVVEGLVDLFHAREAHGQIINLGSTEEVSIIELAKRVKSLSRSESEILFVSYQSAFGHGFEDTKRRVPSIAKARRLINWEPRRDLSKTLQDVIDWQHTCSTASVLVDLSQNV